MLEKKKKSPKWNRVKNVILDPLPPEGGKTMKEEDQSMKECRGEWRRKRRKSRVLEIKSFR